MTHCFKCLLQNRRMKWGCGRAALAPHSRQDCAWRSQPLSAFVFPSVLMRPSATFWRVFSFFFCRSVLVELQHWPSCHPDGHDIRQHQSSYVTSVVKRAQAPQDHPWRGRRPELVSELPSSFSLLVSSVLVCLFVCLVFCVCTTWLSVSPDSVVHSPQRCSRWRSMTFLSLAVGTSTK